MRYFGNPTKAGNAAMDAGQLCAISTPKQSNEIMPGWHWCADNGCFGKGYPGDDAYMLWLASKANLAGTCYFATAPDVIGDAAATLTRSAPFLPRIRALGYRAALVAQDGLEDLTHLIDWDSFDVLFIGGSTDWKLSAAAAGLVAEAKQRGKWVHMGRVNSRKRMRYAESIGVDSCDGTLLTYGPDLYVPKILAWLDELLTNPPQQLALAA